MSTQVQRGNRAPLPTRFSKPGYKIIEMATGFGASFAWKAKLGETLNGTTVAAQTDQTTTYPRPFDTVSYDISQGTAANQPLSTGSPTYAGSPSTRYDGTDSLARAATNFIGALPFTLFSTHVMRATGAGLQGILSNQSAAGGCTLGLNTANRSLFKQGIAFCNDGAVATGTPEAWMLGHRSGTPAQLTVNGVTTALGATTTMVDPGAAATLNLGVATGGGVAANMDWMVSGGFKFILAEGLAYRLMRVLANLGGITFGIALGLQGIFTFVFDATFQ